MSASTFVTLAFMLPAILVFWTMSSTSSSPFARSFPRLTNKRICLLIAHPDDEAMFFSPTVMALTRPELGNHLKILCLSSGNADGLGDVRKKELAQSATQLGLRDESDVYVLDDPTRFPDSMSTMWSESDISDVLSLAFAPGLASSKQNRALGATKRRQQQQQSTPTIDILLTFDQHGISNHPNHRSLYHGAIDFLKTLSSNKTDKSNNNNNNNSPISLYTLTSTNLLRKYIGILDAPLTMFSGVLDGLINLSSRLPELRKSVGTGASGARSRRGRDSPERLLFVNSVQEWLGAQSAMVSGHRSQMVWFRWGWIGIGRYMVVNDLRLVRV